MTSLAPIGGGRTLTSPDAVPARRIEERLEEIARELMTVTAMLRSAELRNHVCSAETVERAKQALTAATPEARQALRAACEPSTLVELGERIAALIQSVPQGDPANAYSAALTMDVGSLQPADGDKLAQEIDCRHRMTRRQTDHLIAPTHEESIGADNNRVGTLLDRTREGRVDLAFAAGIQDHEFNTECMRCSLDVLDLRFRGGIPGVDEEADDGGARGQLAQQFQPFCPECVDKKRHARDVAAGAVQTENEAKFDRIGADRENDRGGCACSFGGQCRRRGERNDRGRGVGHQLGGQCRQPLEATIGRAMFDCQVTALDVAGALQALSNSIDQSIIDLGACE